METFGDGESILGERSARDRPAHLFKQRILLAQKGFSHEDAFRSCTIASGAAAEITLSRVLTMWL
jgi:hypothetical protein